MRCTALKIAARARTATKAATTATPTSICRRWRSTRRSRVTLFRLLRLVLLYCSSPRGQVYIPDSYLKVPHSMYVTSLINISARLSGLYLTKAEAMEDRSSLHKCTSMWPWTEDHGVQTVHKSDSQAGITRTIETSVGTHDHAQDDKCDIPCVTYKIFPL
jgi:hypothetical protein